MSGDETIESYNEEEVQRDSDGFTLRLLALTHLTPNHKLGVTSSNVLFIETLENGHLQAWWRKMCGQSRVVVCNFLKKELYDYYLFLLFLKQLLEVCPGDSVVEGMCQTHSGFLPNVVQGLCVLSDTYPEYAELLSCCTLYKTRFSDCIKLLERKEE